MKDILKSALLFQGLTEGDLNELHRIVVKKSFPKGEIVFSEGDEGTGFYLLKSGRVKVFKMSPAGKEQVLHIITPGEPFGEVSVFTGKPFPAYAETIEDSEVLYFPRDGFIKMIKKRPSIAMNMLAVLSMRLKEFVSTIEGLALKEVPKRLGAYLIYEAEKRGENSITLDIPKGLLASMIGTIPETLSRSLSKLAKMGYIEVDGPKIRIKDLEGLKEFSS